MYGYEPPKEWKPGPGFEEIKDFNPDCNPSAHKIQSVDRGEDVLLLIPVRGLGVICMRAITSYASKSGDLEFAGVSTFTKSDIGYCPSI